MNDANETHHGLSGGEISDKDRARYVKVRDNIKFEPDVHRLLDLQPDDGRWRYLIQTPFITWPKFVIGTTDDANEEVKILFRCGSEWSARGEWDRLSGEEVES